MPENQPLPPSGHVALLFTDIEGSTARWEKYGPHFGEALHEHDRIMRAAIAQYNGYEVKTIGDAFMVAFGDALEAALCAAQAQREFQNANENFAHWRDVEGVRVRIGIHCGEPECRGGDYFGPVVNRAARVSDTGQGGMTVLSLAAKESVAARLPSPLELEDCGPRRLKDLTEPQSLFVLWTGTETVRPPVILRTLSEKHNIPGQLNSFVGRGRERRELAKLLREGQERLITLTGPGGAGKTRLSMQVAVDQAHLFPGGIWFVELANVRNPDEVPVAVALALRLDLRAGTEPRRQIADYLRDSGKRCLLVLDNFEQVTDAALFLQDLLRDCPLLLCLVSSRDLLMLSAEREFPLEPLPVPPLPNPPTPFPNPLVPRREGGAESAAALSPPSLAMRSERPGKGAGGLGRWLDYESVQLFTARAQTASRNFELTEETAPIVGEICRRLEGLPLSIELAAAQIRRFSPREIQEKLVNRLDALQSQFRDLTERQRTLRGAIQWSHDLLNETEQAIFSELAVFQGGFFADTAEAVCLTSGASAFVPTLRDKSLIQQSRLDSLRDQSLIHAENHSGEIRYFMLESIRDYALEKLESAGRINPLRHSHARVFLQLAEPASKKLLGSGADAQQANERLTLELDNLRAGMDWTALQNQNAETAAYGNALTRFLIKRGVYPECDARLQTGIEAAAKANDGKTQAILLNRRGLAARDSSRLDDARLYFQQCAAVSKAAGETVIAQSALSNLGSLEWGRSDYDAAQKIWTEALDFATAGGQKALEADLRVSLGGLLLNRGEYDAAEAHYARSLEIHAEARHQEGIAYALFNRAFLRRRQGNSELALTEAREANRLFRELGNRNGIALTCSQIAYFLHEAGQAEEGKILARESLKLAREAGIAFAEMNALETLACLNSIEDFPAAQNFFRQSLAIARHLGDRRHSAIALRHYADNCRDHLAAESLFLIYGCASRLFAELQHIDFAIAQNAQKKVGAALAEEICAELQAKSAAFSLEAIESLLNDS